MNRFILRLFSSITGSLLFTIIPASGQIFPEPPLQITSPSIQTAGGITYFTFTTPLRPCEYAGILNLARTETSTMLTLGRATAIGCIPLEPCPECAPVTVMQTSVVVLGQLPAGGHRLTVMELNSGITPFRLVLTTGFDVPEWSGPTLTAVHSGADIEIKVAGVPLAQYMLEASSNLTDWTPVRANTGAPFTFKTNITVLPEQFFRVRASNGTTFPQ